jgi:tetratricopeptide (TPR) repeat protein
MVDSISLPRNTLARATGDCDDLTVLYASLLETLGVATGFITVPGHIYTVFNSGVSSREYKMLHPDREMIIDLDGQAWIPVEVTLIGRENFLGAWRTGIELWNRAGDDSSTRGFYLTSAAQDVYRPVGLRERDLGLQYGDEDVIRSAFVDDQQRLIETILSSLREEAENSRSAPTWNRYGIGAARLERYRDASQAFRQASLSDQSLLSPRVNLGSVSFLQGDYRTALSAYLEAERLLRARGRDGRSNALATVLINVSRSHYELANYDQAESYYAQAAEQGPEVVEQFSYLANVASDGATGRASDAGQGPDILFMDEE